MKKILVVAALMLSSVSTFAQHAVGSFNLQPKVGVSIANLTEVKGSDPLEGVVAGVEGEYQASDIFSVSAGVLYSMQGTKVTDDVTNRLDYINVPIMANVYVVKGLAVKLGVQRLKDLGLNPIFLSHSLKGLDFIKDHPEARAEDLIHAFSDDSIDMILCAIGGDDTYRLLPYLFENDQLQKVIKQKIFLGFSDNATR